MIDDGGLEQALTDRYSDWDSADNQAMMAMGLEEIEARVRRDNINPTPRSGRQEILENYVNRFV